MSLRSADLSPAPSCRLNLATFEISLLRNSPDGCSKLRNGNKIGSMPFYVTDNDSQAKQLWDLSDGTYLNTLRGCHINLLHSTTRLSVLSLLPSCRLTTGDDIDVTTGGSSTRGGTVARARHLTVIPLVVRPHSVVPTVTVYRVLTINVLL